MVKYLIVETSQCVYYYMLMLIKNMPYYYYTVHIISQNIFKIPDGAKKYIIMFSFSF